MTTGARHSTRLAKSYGSRAHEQKATDSDFRLVKKAKVGEDTIYTRNDLQKVRGAATWVAAFQKGRRCLEDEDLNLQP